MMSTPLSILLKRRYDVDAMYIYTTMLCYAVLCNAMPCKNAHANASLCRPSSYAIAMSNSNGANAPIPEHRQLSNGFRYRSSDSATRRCSVN